MILCFITYYFLCYDSGVAVYYVGMKKENTYKLLSRYASKTITAAEWEELKVAIENTSDEELLDMLCMIWEKSEYSNDNIPAGKKLVKIFKYVRGKTKSKDFARKTLRYALRIAAVLLLAFLTGATGYLYKDREYRINISEKDVIVNVARGQRVMLTLPDSSVVHLNSESMLSYKQDYGYKDRKVMFKGEGFFEVRKDVAKTFVVGTEYLDVEVKGTSFNFYAYDNVDEVELALIQGSVSVQTKTAPVKSLSVKPNEKVIYNKKTGSMKLEKANVRFDTAWTRNELVFRSEPMKNVLREIERRYGVYIHVDDVQFTSDKFTGYFAYNSVRDVMEELKTHYKFKYKIEGEQILIYD